VALAEILAPSSLPSLPDSEFKAAVATLKEHDVDFPTITKQALLQRSIAAVFSGAELGEEDSLNKLIAMTRPWTSTSDVQEFDPETPCLYAMEGTPAEKCMTCQKKLIKDLLLPLIMHGEAKAEVVKTVCRVMLKSFVEGLPEESVDEIQQMVVQFMTLWRALDVLLTPDNFDTSASADFDSLMQGQMKSPGFAMCRDAMAENEHYPKLIKAYELARPHHRTLGVMVTRTVRVLPGWHLGLTQEAVAFLTSTVQDLTKARAHLRKGALLVVGCLGI
jgi:hypothetical protein